jgi:hypothetical protein
MCCVASVVDACGGHVGLPVAVTHALPCALHPPPPDATPATRRQYLALKHEPTREEISEATQDLSSWLASLKSTSTGSGEPLPGAPKGVGGSKPPAPRASAAASSVGAGTSSSGSGSGSAGRAAAVPVGDDERPWTEKEKEFAATREKQKGAWLVGECGALGVAGRRPAVSVLSWSPMGGTNPLDRG